MNDLGLDLSQLPPELAAQLAGVANKRRIADAMLSQSMSPIENMGGPGANLHWTQGAAKVLQAYLGRRGLDAANAERESIGRQASEGTKAAMADYLRTKQGVPAAMPLTPMDDEGNAMPADPGVKADPRKAIAEAYANKFLANSPFLRAEQAGLDRADDRESQRRTILEGIALKAALDKPAAEKDPESVRLARIANDANRPPAERQAAADALKKMTAPPAPVAQVSVNTPIDNFKNEKTLREEFEDRSKSFVKVRDAFGQIRDSLAGDITAPATLAAATKFMKMLDPESVVRESELNMALKSTGLMDRFLNLHNVVTKGGVLTPAQAAEIQRIAGVLYQTAETNQKKVSDYYTGLANDYKLDPKRIVRDLSLGPAPQAAKGLSGAEQAELDALRKRFGKVAP